jgi:UDP-N-acetyl-D-glucosamine dehydrogenase
MPRFVLTRVMDALNERKKSLNGSKILVLGAAYKPDIDDLRESPALDVIGLLDKKGAEVNYHDPYVSSLQLEGRTRFSVKDLDKAVEEADCVVIITNHKVYDYAKLLDSAKLIVDTRNALGKAGHNNPKVVRL